MKISTLLVKLKGILKPAGIYYPLLIIASIPLLLTINTLWNLKSFRRDVNFIIRHQAVSIADAFKPVIEKNIENPDELTKLLNSIIDSSEDIVWASVFTYNNSKYEVLSSTIDTENALKSSELGLNNLAVSFNEPFAGLYYEPQIGKTAWNVVTPLNVESQDKVLLSMSLKTEVVEALLKRTSNDSIIILSVLVVITLILLANHFYFYRRAMEARQLEEIDKLKDEFISMAAHELRAPITALTGYLELLQSKISPEQLPALQEDLTILDSLTSDLHDLIDDLLNVSRIEQGRIEVNLVETQINQVIKKVVDTTRPSANQKGLEIVFEQAIIPSVKTDPDRLRQIITNLISNAVKYSVQGKITLQAIQKHKVIEISVKDTGIGIPADQLPLLFTKFHRVKDKQTQEVRGTGLGLWIVKQVVEMLGGKIYVESIYGTGSVFRFTIPVTA